MASACTVKTHTANATSAVQTTAVTTTTATMVSGQTTAATSMSETSGGIPAIADRKSLSSYRYTIMTKLKGGADAESTDYMKYEYVRDQKAEHAWREDASGIIIETYIQIGDKNWIWFPGMGWIEQPPKTGTESSLPTDLSDQLKKAQQQMEQSKMRFEKKGTETVNSVKCIKYEYDYYLTNDMPNMATGGTNKTEMHESGSLWIADQASMPAVVIRLTGTTEMKTMGEITLMESENNLTDIGATISISPPGSAMTIPTNIITTPAVTSATQPTTGTLLYEDNFQNAWGSGWEWLDPNDDAKYDFASHSGFLRLTVPDGNDLAGVSNYDAPRLLVQQQGDFSMETLIEFDPKEYYQGAGILLWQDENAFLRLEFSFGGMGGEAKNVVFVKQEEGYLDLVGSIDLPESTKRIELRLQRQGNEHTAWYRLAGGSWQEIGSCEVDLMSTVMVGIAQVTQYTPSEISADFDYFRVFPE